MAQNRKLTLTSGGGEKGQIDFKPLASSDNPLVWVSLHGPDFVVAPIVISLPDTIVDLGLYKSDSFGNQYIEKLLNVNVDAAAAIALTKLAATTVSRALVSDGSGFVSPSAVTSVELGYVSGVTSAIQTQLDSKQTVTLTNGNILMGNVSNVATSVTPSGVIAITNAGVTSYSGTVPLNKGGTGQTTKAPAFDALSPMTTGGDLIYGGASGTGTRLPNGTAGQALLSAGTTLPPVWTTTSFTPVRSEVWLYGNNNYGSTNTAIQKWTTVGKNTGTAMTLTQSSTNGDSILINEDGVYSMSFSKDNNAGQVFLGISRNSSQLTTAIQSITATDIISITMSTGINFMGCCGVTLFLQAGDVIRSHGDGNAAGSCAGVSFFRVTKVAN